MADNGSGGLTGTGIASGTIDYATGALSVTYTVDPASALPITMSYSYTGPPSPPPSGYSCGLPSWCSGIVGMSAAQLQQAADLMGAVIAVQLFGPVLTGTSSQSYSQDGEAPGAVTSATEGSVSASFQLPEIGTSAFSSMLLASPPYGRMLLALLQIAASVGFYIPSGRFAYVPP